MERSYGGLNVRGGRLQRRHLVVQEISRYSFLKRFENRRRWQIYPPDVLNQDGGVIPPPRIFKHF